jgi:hypothetical protein
MRRLSVFVALCLFAPNGFAQAWPNRPMRLVMPFDPIRDLIPGTLAVNGLNVLVVNPAARMILPHFAIPASMNARNCSGVLPTGPAPSASSFSLIDGCRSSATTS